MRTRPVQLAILAIAVLALTAAGVPAVAAVAADGRASAPIAGPPPACDDDAYEQNDTRDDAPALLQPVEITNLVSCPNDTDWFMFHLFAGDHIAIDALYDGSSGDLAVSLHGPTGELWATATLIAAGHQHVAFSAPASGIYYVKIDPPAEATQGIDYVLALTGDATPTPTPLPPTPTPAKALGDVNDDASVNAIDAALILQYTAGLLSSLPNTASADADASGGVDSIDAALVLQYEAGLIPRLPVL